MKTRRERPTHLWPGPLFRESVAIFLLPLPPIPTPLGALYFITCMGEHPDDLAALRLFLRKNLLNPMSRQSRFCL